MDTEGVESGTSSNFQFQKKTGHHVVHPESICYLLRKLYEYGQHLRTIEDNDKQRKKNKEGRKKGEATE